MCGVRDFLIPSLFRIPNLHAYASFVLGTILASSLSFNECVLLFNAQVNSFREEFEERVRRIAFTDSVHSVSSRLPRGNFITGVRERERWGGGGGRGGEREGEGRESSNTLVFAEQSSSHMTGSD